MGELTSFCTICADLPPFLATRGRCHCRNRRPSSVSTPPFLRAPLPLQHSMILRLLRLLHLSLPLISLCLQTGGLTSVSDVRNLLAINPLVMLCQNACAIHSESSNSCLVLDGIFELLLLRILRKRELGFCLGSIITRHGSSGKTKKREVASKSALYPKGLVGPRP